MGLGIVNIFLISCLKMGSTFPRHDVFKIVMVYLEKLLVSQKFLIALLNFLTLGNLQHIFKSS